MMIAKMNDLRIEGSSIVPEDIISHKGKPLTVGLRAGMACPCCHQAQLDYNGLLQLMCPRCGVVESGTFT
jgi:hypothetical protein